MATTRCLITTEPRGTGAGTAFEGITSSINLKEAAITRIIVGYNTSYIISLEVHYAENKEPAIRRGGTDGTKDEVVLDAYEYITMIEGAANEAYITRLAFTTNKRRWGPFGGFAGECFIWRAADRVPADVAPRMRLLCFRGNADNILRRLQATFVEHPTQGSRKSPNVVRYESASASLAMMKVSSEAPAKTSAVLSKFGFQIMSPIITVRVGKEKSEFHAHLDILCQLPFFRAALKGQFREASEKAINMPEDEPETISALIEFLYTGSYTYVFDPDITDLADATLIVPTSDLTQGSFHVAMYAVASKYDCQLLANGAVAKFREVIQQLNSIDIVRLCKVAYSIGLNISKWGTDDGLSGFKMGLGKLVNVLYTTHGEEMESIMSEYPALASDLLRLASARS